MVNAMPAVARPARRGSAPMMTDLFSLEGRTALITGGSRGIGKMIARGFIAHGVRELAAAVNAREPKLDILVNNAGAAWAAEFDVFPENGWDKVMDLNVKTP